MMAIFLPPSYVGKWKNFLLPVKHGSLYMNLYEESSWTLWRNYLLKL